MHSYLIPSRSVKSDYLAFTISRLLVRRKRTSCKRVSENRESYDRRSSDEYATRDRIITFENRDNLILFVRLLAVTYAARATVIVIVQVYNKIIQMTTTSNVRL